MTWRTANDYVWQDVAAAAAVVVVAAAASEHIAGQ